MKLITPILVLLLLLCWLYVRREGGRISVTSQHAILCLSRGGYRSWGISYSYVELSCADGKRETIYHFPSAFHMDTRNLE